MKDKIIGKMQQACIYHIQMLSVLHLNKKKPIEYSIFNDVWVQQPSASSLNCIKKIVLFFLFKKNKIIINY